MDKYEIIGYTCLGALAVVYLLALIAGMIVAFPFGLLGFVALLGIGALFMKVLRERLHNDEDTYYSKNVEK